jgi:UDPglucose 6-dehydrogenase
MKITVVGLGSVGLVTGSCFAEMGNTVYGIDNDQDKINTLSSGRLFLYEPGLKEMIARNCKASTLFFSTDLKEALSKTDICFITVGTPRAQNGDTDLSQVLAVATEIGQAMVSDLNVIIKSTVPVGTAAKVHEIIFSQLSKRGVNIGFKVISNPEFLKEGAAIADCMSPDRVVVGAPDQESSSLMRELYAPFVRTSDRFIIMDVPSAEMTKYASNAMLATRISFINEMANICEAVGADVNQVRLGIGSDSRIGYSFLFAGCGYGGSCFPKDLSSLINAAKAAGCRAGLLQQVEDTNKRQKLVLAKKVVKRFGEDLSGLKFAVWGLSYKPNTDDVREAPSAVIISELIKRKASVAAYDPKAMEKARSSGDFSDEIEYVDSKYDALNQAAALILVTEWKEFRSPDFQEIKQRMKSPIIFDGRNQYKKSFLDKLGFEYHQIGVNGSLTTVS